MCFLLSFQVIPRSMAVDVLHVVTAATTAPVTVVELSPLLHFCNLYFSLMVAKFAEMSRFTS